MTPARPPLALLLCLALLAVRPARAQSAMGQLAQQVARGLVARALTAEQEGRTLAAEALYRQALEADAGALPAHLGHARLLARRGLRVEALRALEAVPPRAYAEDEAAVQFARVRADLGDLDSALALLAARPESAAGQRACAELAAGAGRFPEALRAARQLTELLEGDPVAAAAAARLVRALAIVVGEADAVRAPGPAAPLLRRVLAQ
jgi:tetratricopeptide (TPR) repeat protein